MKTRSRIVNELLVKATYISIHEGLIQVFLEEIRDCRTLWERKKFIAGELAIFYPSEGKWVLFNSGFIPSSEILTTVAVTANCHSRIFHVRRRLSD